MSRQALTLETALVEQPRTATVLPPTSYRPSPSPSGADRARPRHSSVAKGVAPARVSDAWERRRLLAAGGNPLVVLGESGCSSRAP
jgi:hypothetical protein